MKELDTLLDRLVKAAQKNDQLKTEKSLKLRVLNMAETQEGSGPQVSMEELDKVLG